MGNLTKRHWEQLLSYIEYRARDGWYQGNRAQFEKRHDELKDFVLSKLTPPK